METLRGDALGRGASVVGAVVGLLAWLPVPDADRICPPPGEGRTQCVLNEVWVSALLHVMLGALAGALLVAAVRHAPEFLRSQREWTRRQAAPVPPEPDLLAARWDHMDGWIRDEAAPAAEVELAAGAEPPRARTGRFDPPPLPVGDDGRLAPDDLRAWLAATGPAATGPR